MQQDKLGQAGWMLHISKTQPETAASLRCPSLPRPTATCSCLLSARIYNIHCPDRTFFAFRKHTKYTDITENTQVVSVPRLTQGGDCRSNVLRAVRKDQECAAAGTPLWGRSGFISASALSGPATHPSTKYTAWDFPKWAEAKKKQEKHKLLLWPWLLSWLIVVTAKMKVTGLKI